MHDQNLDLFLFIFLHPYMAPFGPLMRKNIIVWLNPPSFGGHSEDFRPILRIRTNIPKIGGAERSGFKMHGYLSPIFVLFSIEAEFLVAVDDQCRDQGG